jgi:hypothetical protein
VKHIATNAISTICNHVACKFPFIERKVEVNTLAESYKTPEPKSACRDLEKEARYLNFLTQLGSEDCAMSEVFSEEILSRSPGSPDSDKTLVMEDVSNDGEDLVSPRQVATQESILDLVDPTKAKEPKMAAVVTPKFSEIKKLPQIMLDGKTVLKPLTKKRRCVELLQSNMNQFSQFIRYGEGDSEVEDL